jgi:hypothetical protein|tara:strand:- start:678 stop:884 length:207 start_codon:yes stop_codon:yes gene_type:complete
MEKLYRIEELTTEGWTLIDEVARNLTKEKANVLLDQYINAGVNPNRLRAVRDVKETFNNPTYVQPDEE